MTFIFVLAAFAVAVYLVPALYSWIGFTLALATFTLTGIVARLRGKP